ncbi:calcium-dependent phosphotriesterase superfamily protein [Actinidia rufa]|uniref:Calcium-dependent phosphotriesterase superfamily protein n=1 Tax=Actinidia rufa TaxID=165716 RepID=A0A7J0DCF1_9ERIC|nr:calcium-dependent phosphotriesterase superfamily protein [Actinidia rufa]
MGEDGSWETFALVTKNWSEKVCAKGVDSTMSKQWKVEPHCGRPLGQRFDKNTGDLYIVDAYYGLLIVGPEGGIATPLATHVEGKPIFFANDLDIHKNGSILFTDTSKRYNECRLLRYDPPTRTTHVISDGLAFPNGVELSKDRSFLLLTETTNCRLMKYWLEGPKRGPVKLIAKLPGFPDNWIRSVYFRPPIWMWHLARVLGMRMYTVVSLFSEKEEVLDVLEDKQGKVMKLVSEVREAKGKLWIGTVAHNHIATLPCPLK